MFYDYKIVKNKNEEILFLFLNVNLEFAKRKAKQKKKDLNKNIIDFIKDNNINFKGKTVAIVASGLVITTVILNDFKHTPNDNNININYATNILESFQYQKSNTPEIIEEIKIEDEIPKKINKNIDKISKSTTSNKKNEKNKSQNYSNQAQPFIEENTKPTNIDTSNNLEVIEEIVDNNIYINIKRSNGNLQTLELEEYVVGVVGAEMPASFNIEALKAQAIIARTYALKSNELNKQLTDDSNTQNYKDNNQLKSMWGSSFNTYYKKITNAVSETKGMYLTYNENIVDAVYHSTSNGKTEDSMYVWKNNIPYLVSVDSPYDTTNSSFLKNITFSYQELSEKFGFIIDINTEFDILSKTTGNRVLDIIIDGNSYTGVEIRNILGLRSADFDISKNDSGITFTTRGYGHGVGMSQYGANGMANNGYKYDSILKHYYKGVNISKLT